jgi:hypothetical protein
MTFQRPATSRCGMPVAIGLDPRAHQIYRQGGSLIGPVEATFSLPRCLPGFCRFFEIDRFCRSRPCGNPGLLQQIG